MALVAALIVAGLYLAHRTVAIASSPLESVPFQSGWLSTANQISP